MKERIALFLQFAISTAIGTAVYAAMLPDFKDVNIKAPVFAGLIAGFLGGYLVMFLYVWIRYGWQAAKSLKLDGN